MEKGSSGRARLAGVYDSASPRETGAKLLAEQFFSGLFFTRSNILGGGAGVEDSEELGHFRTGP